VSYFKNEEMTALLNVFYYCIFIKSKVVNVYGVMYLNIIKDVIFLGAIGGRP